MSDWHKPLVEGAVWLYPCTLHFKTSGRLAWREFFILSISASSSSLVPKTKQHLYPYSIPRLHLKAGELPSYPQVAILASHTASAIVQLNRRRMEQLGTCRKIGLGL